MAEPVFRVTNRRKLTSGGLVVGQSVAEAKEQMRGARMPRTGVQIQGIGDTNPVGREGRGTDDVLTEMSRNRRINGMRRTATAGGSPGGYSAASVNFATGRPRDPMFYWRQNNLPYDVSKEEELKKIREFCNTPDAPVWMGDYSFKPMGEVQAGDEVIGWIYNTGPTGQQRKKLVRTRVLATKRRMAPEVVRVTMESGRVIRCTPDHLWANPSYSPSDGSDWRQPEFRPVKVGRELVRVIDPTPDLSSEKERLTAAWLSGIYDGEGYANSIGQSASHNPDVCERIKHSLSLLGLPWTQRDEAIFIRRAGQGYRAGAQQDLVNFLNWTDPVRKVTKGNDEMILTRPGGGKDKIVSIESEGPGEVVSMQTETGNYIAWGYASKNCRLLYLTHPIVAACTDIFTKFPLQGMHFECKDDQLTDFYSSLFFDQLDYENYLLDVGREYWLTGEAWPLGSFNESLGVWDDDELLNPNDVEVERSPFLKDPRFLIRLPESLRKVLQERAPRWEYEALIRNYPELQAYATENALMPVSNMLLKQLKFKGDTFNKRGVPILMRGFRAIVQEEMLNAAMDAIADRLYTPLILVKLGASATDLGTQVPWIPTSDDLADFEESLDAALAADFRALVHHFGVDMAPVFGRENMPDMTADFDRIEDRILMVYGLSRTLLQGASSGETYAADAINRDIVTQLLTSYQKLLKNMVKDRALIVAEAQEHYDYEVRGGKRYVKMEEIYEIDEETGEEQIVEQPALLVPDLEFDSMTLSDEEQERQFLEALADKGVPVPYKARLRGTGLDFESMMEERQSEQVALAIAEQETRRETYKALRDANLPIPDDLVKDFRPIAKSPGDGPVSSTGDMAIPTLGVNPMGTPALAPTLEDQMDADVDDPMAPAPMMQDGPTGVEDPESRPEESDEQRANMPKPAKKTAVKDYDYERGQIRRVTASYYVAPDNSQEVDVEGKPILAHYRPTGKFGDPRHIGMRRYVEVPPESRVAVLDIESDEE